MIVRALYFLVLAGLAPLVIAVQLDRQAYSDPVAVALTPEPFRGVAQQRLVEASLTSVDGEVLQPAVRELVRRRPLPARHTLLYAQVAERAGDTDAAIAALEVAAVRGWREPLAQLAVAQAGLLSGDYAVAAQRAAALSATGGASDQLASILAALVAEEDGRQALADLLTGEGAWKRQFIPKLYSAGTPEHFAEIISMAWDRGAMLDCTQLERVAARLLNDGRQDLATRIWQGDCARQRGLSTL